MKLFASIIFLILGVVLQISFVSTNILFVPHVILIIEYILILLTVSFALTKLWGLQENQNKVSKWFSVIIPLPFLIFLFGFSIKGYTELFIVNNISSNTLKVDVQVKNKFVSNVHGKTYKLNILFENHTLKIPAKEEFYYKISSGDTIKCQLKRNAFGFIFGEYSNLMDSEIP